MARSSRISKVKQTLKGSVGTAQERVGRVVGKARDRAVSISPVGLPTRGAARGRKAPAPEPLEPQQAPRKVHGDALRAGEGSTPIARRTATTESTARKVPAGGPSTTKAAKRSAARAAGSGAGTDRTASGKAATNRPAGKTATQPPAREATGEAAKNPTARKAPAEKSPARRTRAEK